MKLVRTKCNQRTIPLNEKGEPQFSKSEKRLLLAAARTCIGALALSDYRMIAIGIETPGYDPPPTFLFALGDRAGELNEAWLEIKMRHEPAERKAS